MKATANGLLVVLSAAGLFAGGTAAAQKLSQHVLHDVVTGTIKPAKITVRPAPNAAPIAKTMPFFPRKG